MSEQLQHDPRTKLQIKEALYSYLYQPVNEQFKHRLDTLIVKNAVINKYTHKSFMYKSELYTCDPAPAPRKMNRLHPSLVKEMDDYIKELKELNEQEIPYVVGFINQVLNSSNDLCDYLRLFPEAVHDPIRRLIATCPCKTAKLPAEDVQSIQERNSAYISLMQKRMVINLLIR